MTNDERQEFVCTQSVAARVVGDPILFCLSHQLLSYFPRSYPVTSYEYKVVIRWCKRDNRMMKSGITYLCVKLVSSAL